MSAVECAGQETGHSQFHPFPVTASAKFACCKEATRNFPAEKFCPFIVPDHRAAPLPVCYSWHRRDSHGAHSHQRCFRYGRFRASPHAARQRSADCAASARPALHPTPASKRSRGIRRSPYLPTQFPASTPSFISPAKASSAAGLSPRKPAFATAAFQRQLT
jgi:hypothetical protein